MRYHVCILFFALLHSSLARLSEAQDEQDLSNNADSGVHPPDPDRDALFEDIFGPVDRFFKGVEKLDRLGVSEPMILYLKL